MTSFLRILNEKFLRNQFFFNHIFKINTFMEKILVLPKTNLKNWIFYNVCLILSRPKWKYARKVIIHFPRSNWFVFTKVIHVKSRIFTKKASAVHFHRDIHERKIIALRSLERLCLLKRVLIQSNAENTSLIFLSLLVERGRGRKEKENNPNKLNFRFRHNVDDADYGFCKAILRITHQLIYFL